MRFIVLSLAFIFLTISLGIAIDKGQELSLRDIISLSLKQNPKIASSYNLYEASMEIYATSGAQPNPNITLSHVKGEPPEESNRIVQNLELFGRPQFRKSVAEAAMGIEEASYWETRQDLALETTLTYIEALKSAHMREVEEENVKLSESSLKVAQKRYDVGDIPLLQLLQFKISFSRARSDLEAAILARQKALLGLSRLMNSPLPDTTKLEELPPGTGDPLPALEELIASALAGRPELAKAQWELKQALSEKSLIASQNHPDFVLSAFRPELFDESPLSVGFSIAVPLLDWGSIRGEVRASEKKGLAAHNKIIDEINTIRYEVEEAFREAMTLRSRLNIVNYDIISDQKRMNAMVRRGYEAGLNSYIEVLDANQALRNIKAEYYTILSEYQAALARLEKAAATCILSKEGQAIERD